MPANHTPDSASHHSQPKIQLPDALHFWRQEVFHQGGVAVLREHLRSNHFAWHRHDQLQLLLVLDKAVCEAEWQTQETESVSQRLTGDMVWIVPPGRLHALAWPREAELIVLYCDLAWAGRFGPVPSEIAIEPLSSYLLHSPLVGELCWELRRSCHDRNPWVNDTAAALGLTLAGQLLGAHFKQIPKGPKRWAIVPASMRRLLEYIEQNLGEELPISELARMAGLSEHYFIEIFRDYTGLPPQFYILRQRINRAKKMLRTGEHTVGAVALSLGFFDQAHMDRQFRHFCGAPPSTWLPGPGPDYPSIEGWLPETI